MPRTWFSLAFALAVLAVLLAGPGWLRPVEAQDESDLEARLAKLEQRTETLLDNHYQLANQSLPPLAPYSPGYGGTYAIEPRYAFVIVCNFDGQVGGTGITGRVQHQYTCIRPAGTP